MWRCRHKAFQWFLSLYWILGWYGWYLWKYWSQRKEGIWLIVFDHMIADVLSNNNITPIVTELFIRRKINISLVIKQSYFVVSKNVRLNSTQYLFMKIWNKWGL